MEKLATIFSFEPEVNRKKPKSLGWDSKTIELSSLFLEFNFEFSLFSINL